MADPIDSLVARLEATLKRQEAAVAATKLQLEAARKMVKPKQIMDIKCWYELATKRWHLVIDGKNCGWFEDISDMTDYIESNFHALFGAKQSNPRPVEPLVLNWPR